MYLKDSEIKHIVVLKYKSTVTKKKQSEIFNKFLAMKDEAKKDGKSYIYSIVGGNCSNSIEKLNQNFNQVFILTFSNQADFDYYIGQPFYSSFDPIHDEFKKFVAPFLAIDKNGNTNGAMVFDFIPTNDAKL